MRCALASAAVGCAIMGAAASGAMVPIPAGETVLFSDDFANNNAGWTNVVTTAESGKAFIETDPLGSGETVWHPSLGDANNGVASRATIPTLDLHSDVALYMRVRTLNTTGQEASRFHIRVQDKANNNFILIIRPNASAQFQTSHIVDSARKDLFTTIGGWQPPAEFVSYRFQITGNPDGESATLRAFRYDEVLGEYVSMGPAMETALLAAGEDGTASWIEINSRNASDATTNSQAYFDSVAVTLVPEPAGAAVLGLGGLALAWRRRRRA